MMLMKKATLKFIKAVIPALLLSFSAFAQPGTGGTIAEGIIGVVGENIILKTEVDGQFEALKRQYQQQGMTITKCEVLEDLLMEKLLLHHAKVDSITVDEGEIDQNIERRIQALVAQFGGDESKLIQYYGKSIFEIKEEMRPLMRNQMTAQRMQFSITQDVEVTPTEVQEFYNRFPQDSLPLINTEIELAQIVIYPEVDEEAEQATREKLLDIKKRIEEGRSFSTMAILYSEDPGSNKKGGLYEGIKRGQFVKEFEAIAFNLQPGEVSDPVRTVFGYHIIQLVAKRGEELDLRHILIRPDISDANLNEAKAVVDSIRSVISSGAMTFEEAVEEFSEDDATKYNSGVMMNPNTGDTKWDVSGLDQGTFYAIQDLDAGEISQSVLWRDDEQKEAFRLVKVVSRTEPHRANMVSDYGRLRSIALQEKQAKQLQEWISEKIQETYIRINHSYYDCTFKQDWEQTGDKK